MARHGRRGICAAGRLRRGEPLDGAYTNSAKAWYVFADPAALDTIEYAYLDGDEGPVVETEPGFRIDGVEIKCRLDFGAGVLDWRGAYRNPGA